MLSPRLGENGGPPWVKCHVYGSMAFALDQRTHLKFGEPGGYHPRWDTSFGYVRDFLENRLVYLVICPRAHGLAIGVNLNSDRTCNFECAYCEVNRGTASSTQPLDVESMVRELDATLELFASGKLQRHPRFQHRPPDLLRLQQVFLTGDGEPTLCPNFAEAVRAVVHLRALGKYPFFKLVLVTNASELARTGVEKGWQSLTPNDEIWAKLDAGTEEYFNKVNRTSEPFDKILSNIRLVGRQRPVVIQSLFSRLQQEDPSDEEIACYVNRLRELQADGASISQVQVYSALQPTRDSTCEHLPLRQLSRIAQNVRAATGLRVEVF
jgi:wyosine [tRNA(Phe)-imidazoG37] synthetase (radical SAM superfamily)